MIEWCKKQVSQTDWKVLLFLVLVLNVKLVIKILAVILLIILSWKTLPVKNIFRQRYLFFYFGMVSIGLINLLLQYKVVHIPYLIVWAMGILFWIMAVLAATLSFHLVQNAEWEKLSKSVTLFFLVHISLIFFRLLLIMWETGTINPYTYKGFNQKYYLSTGDSITGITFDSPVTTAVICAFGVLFFLYNRRFLFSILSMAALLIIFSNLTNIFLLLSLAVAFIFRSDKVQKSFIMIFLMMLLIFITRVSPQNNEYVVSFVYKLIGKAYYLPPVKVLTVDELKESPDSILTFDQQKRKKALIYIDSLNSLETLVQHDVVLKKKITDSLVKRSPQTHTRQVFYEYRPTVAIKEKENRFGIFLNEQYSKAEKDSLNALYNWDKPGKAIAYKEVISFLKTHPAKIPLGTGIGNFSSRTAFKAAALDIAGTYPVKFRYIHPNFKYNHLYLYLSYHSQWQIKHTAANTPDSVYNQLLSEYGLAGFFLFWLLFAGYYLRKIRILSYGLPLLCVLVSIFSVEYWFEQLSVVILFEFLMFLDIRSSSEKIKEA